MTDTNNGWPGKPGVPRNPERDGWHIVQEGDLEPERAFWRAKPWLEHTLGCWETKGTEDDFQPYEISNWTYLGPCLTPDEVQNLRDDLATSERERAHQHGRADRNAAEYAREQGRREALQARVAELEEMLFGLLKAFEGVGFRIGRTHPPRTASYEEAEQHYATNYKGETALFMYQQWCQWRLACMARAALEGKKDE